MVFNLKHVLFIDEFLVLLFSSRSDELVCFVLLDFCFCRCIYDCFWLRVVLSHQLQEEVGNLLLL